MAQTTQTQFPFATTYRTVKEIPQDVAQTLRAQYRTLMKDLRKKLECSQDALADSIGVTRSYVNLIEGQHSTCSLTTIDSVVRKAYAQYGVPLDNIPKLPPAEVDSEVLTAAPTNETVAALVKNSRPAVAHAMETFRKEFNVPVGEMYDLLGLSQGHGYLLRYARQGPSTKLRTQVIAKLEAETARRRAAPSTATSEAKPEDTSAKAKTEVKETKAKETKAKVTEAPAAKPAAVATPVTRTDEVIPAMVVPNLAALATALSFDFRTKHRFQTLPDGSILVAKEM